MAGKEQEVVEAALRLLDQTFRRSPRFLLVLARKAPIYLRKAAPGCYGFLIPTKKDDLVSKAVNEDVWRLLTTFRSPRTARGAGLATSDHEQFVAKQLIDKVLEVRCESGFESGVEALRATSGEKDVPARSRIELLSRRAIELAYASGMNDPGLLAARLYCYNRSPLSSKWRERLPDQAAVFDFLRLRADGSWPGMPRTISPLRNEYWHRWEVRGAPRLSTRAPIYKVYLSPLIENAGAVLHHALTELPSAGAGQLKVGRLVAGLLRPDKIVVYFAISKDAEIFARRLAAGAPGRAHGVPFTCQVGATGLVSLGVDPPELKRKSSDDDGGSWRSWVAHRIARAIVTVRREAPAEPIAGVFSAVRAAGIDTERWLPASDHWDFSR